ncbi:CHAD domain-containing protein [Streptomyces sp. RS10V-4]|uniref:CHAD domain-containing protein n=1 Tax=Streptomyces rhizoryzae TaxID=2932493 RepID=UPI0020066C8D|nr:CHAD domain-containing protein [Streptomyces rhizoryzae]MCK7624614.1 CHAD domain-containing protein [Streptomyces rhizoryzae]
MRSGIGIGDEPGRWPGARTAVAVGPGDGVYGDGAYGDGVYGAVRPCAGGAGGTGGAGRAAGGPGPYGPGDGPGAGAGLAGRTAGEVLAGYLHRQAADFLRSLRLHREAGPDAAGAGEAARQLRRSARRISATLHTFRPLTEEVWADQLQAELGWLSGTLAREQACAARRDRLMGALQRLTGRDGRAERPPERGARGGRPGRDARTGRGAAAVPAGPATATVPAAPTGPDDRDALAAGAARAGALLDRQLTLARSRAHSAALQALGSSRFHAVADAVAVLASEAPPARRAGEAAAAEALPPLAEQAHRRLAEAVATLPLARAGHPYNAAALAADDRQDAPWHQARLLVRLSHYAQEVVAPEEVDPRLADAGRALERHRDAAEAAAAAAAAARTPRIAPATAYALGVLHADQRHEVEAARYAFGRVWLTGGPAAERGA